MSICSATTYRKMVNNKIIKNDDIYNKLLNKLNLFYDEYTFVYGNSFLTLCEEILTAQENFQSELQLKLIKDVMNQINGSDVIEKEYFYVLALLYEMVEKGHWICDIKLMKHVAEIFDIYNQPLKQCLLFFVYLAIFSGSRNNLPVVVIGNAMLLCIFTCIGDLGMVYVRERYNGTLKSLIASGKNRLLIFVEKGSIHIIDAFLTSLFGLLIAYLIFKIPIFDYPLFSILFVILVSMFACVGLGFLLGSVCLILTDINLIYNILCMGIKFLCGVNIALEQLPYFFQWISWCLPITRGLKAVEILLNGKNISSVYDLLLGEFILGIILFTLSIFVFSFLEKQARKKATIDLF